MVNKVATKKTATKKIKKEALAQPEINIGMIGHVDHGKTSLTKAMTGKWCDTHSEEVKRGISIRLGYADTTFYKIKTTTGFIYSNKAEGNIVSQRTVSFVDAPGHETLMTTMLSGAALMNGAVLVIAANEECPQARTIEHLMALKFAGVEKIVIAQNKIDLVDRKEVEENYKKIKLFLKEYGYEDAPVVPTSANFGANIDMLIEAIETHILTPKHDLNKPLKMYIARSFDVNKPGIEVNGMKGAILGGSIAQGLINVGDEVELCPGLAGKTLLKIVSLSTNAGLITEALPGGLIGVGTNLDPSIGQSDQLRGRILAKPGTIPDPVKEMDVELNLFERMIDNVNEKIKTNEALVLTIGTNTGIGIATSISTNKAHLVLKNEVVAEVGQRIAISRNINGQWRLIAFGVVM